MPNPMADDDKSKSRTGKKPTAVKNSTERPSQKSATKKTAPVTSSVKGAGTPETGHAIITENEYRALVAQKSYELFIQRCAATEVDDWIQAERLVKEELLARGQTAGFV